MKLFSEGAVRKRKAKDVRSLHKKGYHIRGDEYLGQPLNGYDRVAGAIDQPDDAAQDHVDRGREQCRSNQQEKRLYNVRVERPVGSLGRRDGAADVSYRFEYSADDEGNKVPCSFPDQLHQVQGGRDGEERYKHHSRCQRGIVIVVSKRAHIS